MNRRKFLRWLGIGTAIAAVAPYAFVNKESSVWQANTHYNRMGLRQEEHQCLKEYVDYSNFSAEANARAWDKMIQESALQLIRQMC